MAQRYEKLIFADGNEVCKTKTSRSSGIKKRE